jgi:hypothetical protein
MQLLISVDLHKQCDHVASISPGLTGCGQYAYHMCGLLCSVRLEHLLPLMVLIPPLSVIVGVGVLVLAIVVVMFVTLILCIRW